MAVTRTKSHIFFEEGGLVCRSAHDGSVRIPLGGSYLMYSAGDHVIIVSLDTYWIAFYCWESGELLRVALAASPEAHDFLFQYPTLLRVVDNKYITTKGTFVIEQETDNFSCRIIDCSL